MSKEVETTYVCDLSDKEIDDYWNMLSISVERGSKAFTPRGMSDGETLHVAGDEHNITRGNDEPYEWDITAYVTCDDRIAMFTFQSSWFVEHIDPRTNDDDGWSELADRLETEVFADE